MWRNALAKFHAEESRRILEGLGYDADLISRVSALILRTNFPGDPDSRALEDADCLVFLETKLQDYLEEWGKEKTLRILRQTLSKMTPTAAVLARELQYRPEVAAIMKELG